MIVKLEAVNALAQVIAAIGVIVSLSISPRKFGKTQAQCGC